MTNGHRIVVIQSAAQHRVDIVGAPRVLAAAQNITDALGIVIAINATDTEAGAAASQG